MEKEAEVYGKRTISGFLSKVSAEEAMSADQVIWSEQGRLHLTYKAKVINKDTSLVEIEADIDGVTNMRRSGRTSGRSRGSRSGGSGGGGGGGNPNASGAGGSGIVIIRYKFQ